jgi:hypothetical protein
MKIGGRTNPDLIYPKEIEAFAREANPAAAATKRRVSDLVALVVEKTAEIEQPDETAEKLAQLVAARCESFLSRFK